ncbi:MAG: redoxin domain-containing protein [Phycisphaerales bacterium]|nr:redoxin domain-containing protein [Phycisphaerales bacterium]
MLKALPALLAILLTSVATAQVGRGPVDATPTPQELADRWMELSGGAEFYETMKGRKLTWTFEARGQTGEAVRLSDVKGRFLVTATIAERNAVEKMGSDGTVGWMMTPRGDVEIMTPAMLAHYRFVENPAWPRSLDKAFAEIKTTKKTVFADEACWRVLCLPKVGKPVELYFSVETGRWRGFSTSLLNAQDRQRDLKMTVLDYRDTDGALTPARWELRSASGVMTMQLKELVNNPEIAKGMFDLPEAVKAKTSNQDSTTPPAEVAGGTHARLMSMVGPTLVNGAGEVVPSSVLADKENVLLYFSAKWCPPCRAFTPTLVKYFDDHAADGNFTVILVSSDRSSDDMAKYMSDYKMNFYAVPFDRVSASGIKKTYGDRGIPNLVWLNAADTAVQKSYVNGNYVGPTRVLEAFDKRSTMN